MDKHKMPTKTTHTIQGEAWDQIAKRELNSEMLMHELMTANPQHRRTLIFPANVILNVPDVEVQPVEVAPPWKSL
jgi:hypothetical protein